MLSRITISGADDGVSHADLLGISRRFPYVEWAFPISRSRTAHYAEKPVPRYPSAGWLCHWQTVAYSVEAPLPKPHYALHLCGQMSRAIQHAIDFWLPDKIMGAERIQINQIEIPEQIHTTEFGAMTAKLAREYGVTLILQAGAGQEPLLTMMARTFGTDVLFDASRGRGQKPDRWPVMPPLVARPTSEGRMHLSSYAYAGGLTPANVFEVVTHLNQHNQGRSFGIDIESGVRDENDRMQLGKVVAVLETCSRLLAAP